LYVGGEIIAQKLVIEYTTVTTTLVVTDDVIQTTNTTPATTTTEGALIVAGGAGIGGDLYVGGMIYGTIAGTITSSTFSINLSGGTAGQVPYQLSESTTRFFGPGLAGQVLTSNGALGPAYVTTTSLYVGRATLADDISGGAQGSLVFQDSVNSTTFLTIGTNGYILTSNGTTPQWSPLTGLSAGTASTATNLANGITNQIPYQISPGNTGFVGPGDTTDILVSNSTSSGGPQFTSTSSIFVRRSALSDNLGGGNAGSIPYQSGSNATRFLGIGTSTYILASDGVNPVWVPGPSGTVGSATTATHIAGGTRGQIPFQTDPGRTAFFGPGVAGSILVSRGSNSTGPIYQTTATISTLTVGAEWRAGAIGEIRAENEITAYYSSDIRLKENVRKIDNALDIINQIRGVRFDWTTEHLDSRGGVDEFFVRKEDIGVIAQEVEKVLPEIVATRINGFKGVKYEKLIAVLISAIQELDNEIQELKKKS
jgi:hypothetical protein